MQTPNKISNIINSEITISGNKQNAPTPTPTPSPVKTTHHAPSNVSSILSKYAKNGPMNLQKKPFIPLFVQNDMPSSQTKNEVSSSLNFARYKNEDIPDTVKKEPTVNMKRLRDEQSAISSSPISGSKRRIITLDSSDSEIEESKISEKDDTVTTTTTTVVKNGMDTITSSSPDKKIPSSNSLIVSVKRQNSNLSSPDNKVPLSSSKIQIKPSDKMNSDTTIPSDNKRLLSSSILSIKPLDKINTTTVPSDTKRLSSSSILSIKPLDRKSMTAIPSDNKRVSSSSVITRDEKTLSTKRSTKSSSDVKLSSSSSSKQTNITKKLTTRTNAPTSIVYDPDMYEYKKEVVPQKPTKGANKWWERPSLPKSIKWVTLDHNGILFAPEYIPHGIPVIYDNKEIKLTPKQEEYATYYASVPGDINDRPKQFPINFFHDWKKLLGKDHIIKDINKVDFTKIREHIEKERELRKEQRKDPEIRKKIKELKLLNDSIYSYALVDGFLEKVGNYVVEIPGIFLGRGEHPKTGKIKRRIQPNDVIQNIGKGSNIPPCPIKDSKWGGIVHNPEVTWLAYYKDTITDRYKYVYLASSSKFKGESDRNKYNKARRLCRVINRIREDYMDGMQFTKDLITRQKCTATYLIDRLALRVGNEKDTSEEADTVGCCSLRVEHIEFQDMNTIILDFLGKDSIKYYNQVTVHPQVYKNLQDFCTNKSKTVDVFDKLTTSALNDFLKSYMPEQTAKVFRTYNASRTLEDELMKTDEHISNNDLLALKEQFYNNANREVAIQCNHQRTLPKTHEAQMLKMSEKIDDMRNHLKALQGRSTQYNDKKLPTDKQKRTEISIRLQTRIRNFETKMAMKDDNKTLSLGTSKINYMDPRITVAWCKLYDVPIERIFNKSLLSKFPWAMEVSTKWRFTNINDPELDYIVESDDSEDDSTDNDTSNDTNDMNSTDSDNSD